MTLSEQGDEPLRSIKQFLESDPLYKSIQVELPLLRRQWPKAPVNAECPTCGSSQTFNMVNDYDQKDDVDKSVGVSNPPRPDSNGVRLVYRCAGCGRSHRYYLLHVVQLSVRGGGGQYAPSPSKATAAIQKIGQYPGWDISPDPELAKKLGDRVGTFRKGLICESQGFGIGAFAYYRRIVEDLIDELLEDIRQIIPPNELNDYAAALEKAKQSKRATDKIEHVKDLLPRSLRPGGVNPLSLLHDALSQGLHALSDAECLEEASTIRDAVTILVHHVDLSRASAELFQKNVKRLLDRRATREPPPAD